MDTLIGGYFRSCSILSHSFHPTKQHSICCRSENCISLARSGQSAVDSIDSFDLSNGKVYYRFDKCGRRSDNCISLVTTATRCMIVESIVSFDWWEWLFHSRFHIKSLSNQRIHLNNDYKQMYIPRSKNTKWSRTVSPGRNTSIGIDHRKPNR